MKVVVKKKPKKIPTLLLLGAADERANTAPSLLHLPHETQFSQRLRPGGVSACSDQLSPESQLQFVVKAMF